jgi:hypothetical protein
MTHTHDTRARAHTHTHCVYTDVREQALAALTRIMKACPLLRPAVVYGAADMVLSIPDTNDKLLYHALHKVRACARRVACAVVRSADYLWGGVRRTALESAAPVAARPLGESAAPGGRRGVRRPLPARRPRHRGQPPPALQHLARSGPPPPPPRPTR